MNVKQVNFATYKVPEKEGETLFVPPLAEYATMLKANVAKRKSYTAKNKKLAKLAKTARETALAKAEEYTKKLGLNPGALHKPDMPIIATGHQPVMCHPGVAIKVMTMTKKAVELGATSLFITVDSDDFKGERFLVPEISAGKLGKKEVPIFHAVAEQKIFEQVSAPPFDEIERILKNELLALSQNEALSVHADALSAYIKRLAPDSFSTVKNLADTMTIMRRAWDEPVTEKSYLELPVSLLCDTAPFHTFAKEIFENSEDFLKIYNGELAKYRKERKLRYPVNPFPDLATRKDGWFETPFWAVLEEGGRTRLFVKRDGEGVVLLTEDGDTTVSIDDITSGTLKIRPKAITLTIYLRLFVLDLFIHGVGGAKYDTITDRIIEKFYGIDPPGYACVSATLGLDVPIKNPQKEIDTLTKKIRLTEQNPEKVTGSERGDIRHLANEKNMLVAKMALPETDRKATGFMIRKLNDKMKVIVAPEIKRLKEQLSQLDEVKLAWEAARARDYPCFIRDPATVRSLIS